MADTAQDKAKDKPKKKKTGSSKDKEKAGHDGPEEKKSSKKEEEPVPIAETKPVESSRKPSVTDIEKPSQGSRKKSVSHENNLQHERTERSEDKFKPKYVPPPAATKKDVDLLTDLDEDKLLELKEAFHLFDLDQDGYISARDLKMTFHSLGDTNVLDDDIRSMLTEAISPLDFEAFVVLLGYKTIEMDPEAILIEALAQWDYDNSGLISEDRIKHDLVTWGDKFTKEEADKALEDAPVYVDRRTGTGMIDYIKFCKTLSGLRKKTKMPGMEDFIKNK